MVGLFAHCFKGLRGRIINMKVEEANEKPLNKTEYSGPPTNKPLHNKVCLKPIYRNGNLNATKKKTNKVVRFADKHETIEPLSEKEDLKPRNHKEGFVVEGMKDEIIRVKIKMTQLEAERLLSKRSSNDGVLELRHLAVQLAKVPIHRVHVTTVVAACNKNDNGGVEAGARL